MYDRRLWFRQRFTKGTLKQAVKIHIIVTYYNIYYFKEFFFTELGYLVQTYNNLFVYIVEILKEHYCRTEYFN